MNTKQEGNDKEKTYMGLRTSIFIFCLGVRSPCRITAMTQRSSILKTKTFEAKQLHITKLTNCETLNEAKHCLTCCFPFPFNCYDSHGPRGGGNDGYVLCFSRDRPRNMKLRRQLTHHNVPKDPRTAKNSTTRINLTNHERKPSSEEEMTKIASIP